MASLNLTHIYFTYEIGWNWETTFGGSEQPGEGEVDRGDTCHLSPIHPPRRSYDNEIGRLEGPMGEHTSGRSPSPRGPECKTAVVSRAKFPPNHSPANDCLLSPAKKKRIGSALDLTVSYFPSVRNKKTTSYATHLFTKRFWLNCEVSVKLSSPCKSITLNCLIPSPRRTTTTTATSRSVFGLFIVKKPRLPVWSSR